MGSFIIINTDDLDNSTTALGEKAKVICENAPIDAGSRLMNKVCEFTSGGLDSYDNEEKLNEFNDFFNWHKEKRYVSLKRDDFEEYLKSK